VIPQSGRFWDVARVFEHGLANFTQMKGQIYNVGLSDANVSKKKLCQHLQKFVSDFVFLHEQVGRDPDQRPSRTFCVLTLERLVSSIHR
jgi:hypothetical protein